MGKFELRFVPDREYHSQADYDMDVLSATIKYMGDYYKNIFAGLDGVIDAINQVAKEEKANPTPDDLKG